MTDWLEVGLGLLLISPLDEAILGAATAGASITVYGAQLPATTAAGAYLIADGMGWLRL